MKKKTLTQIDNILLSIEQNVAKARSVLKAKIETSQKAAPNDAAEAAAR